MIEILEDVEQFVPNPGGQAGFMDDFSHRYCAFCGGWNSGKTWAGTRKTLSLHTHNAFDDDGQPTFIASLIVAQNYQLAQTVNIPRFQEALVEANISYKFLADPKIFAFSLLDFGTKERPSLIYVRSADAAAAIAGFEVGAVYGDEVARWPYNPVEPLQDAWLQADGRLRGRDAKVKQFNMTYTPEGDNTRVFVDFELRPKENHKLYRSRTVENVKGDGVDFAMNLAAQLSPELASQYLEGHALSTTNGPVYGSYSEHNQFGQPKIRLDKNLALDWSIDFNIDPGMHGVLGQYNPVLDVASAHYVLHAPRMDAVRMVGDLVTLLRNLEVAGLYKLKEPLNVFGDATGRGIWSATGESSWDVVENALNASNIPYVLKIPSKNPPVSERVQAVNSAMISVSGAVRYIAHERCHLLKRDWEFMRWKNGEIDKRDRRVSHASDADGYRIWYRMPIRKPTPQRSTSQVVFVSRKN